jgi:hypothetical protein
MYRTVYTPWSCTESVQEPYARGRGKRHAKLGVYWLILNEQPPVPTA